MLYKMTATVCLVLGFALAMGILAEFAPNPQPIPPPHEPIPPPHDPPTSRFAAARWMYHSAPMFQQKRFT